MLVDIIALCGGCLFLYLGGEALLEGALRIGRSLQWPDAIIGLVLVSVGTSAPELFVSVGSAIQGYGNIAVGNIVGSNTVNLALVLGIGAFIYPLTIDREVRLTQLPLMLLLSVLTVIYLYNGTIGRLEGGSLIILMTAGLATLFVKGSQAVDYSIAPAGYAVGNSLLRLCAGIAGLVIGAELLIFGGVGLSRDLGISEAVIALTVTALGTSLPEIAATLIAVGRKQGGLAVGNVVGSNIMNIGLVLGFASVLTPINANEVGLFSLLSMLFFTCVVVGLAIMPGVYSRWSGLALLGGYGVYLTLLFG